MAQETPSRELDKVIVRLPDGMRDALKNEASQNNRSMNAEIVAKLVSYDNLLDRIQELEEANREANIASLGAGARILELERKLDEAVKARGEAVEAELRIAAQLREANERLADFENSLSPNLHNRLAEAAADNKRTINGEIAHRLETSFLPNEQSEDYSNLSQRLAAFKLLARVTQRLFRDLADGDDGMAKLSRDLDAMLTAEDEREAERERQFPGTSMRSPFAKAADEGRLAALAGKSEEANPYEGGKPPHEGWAAGYLFAQDEIEQANLRKGRSEPATEAPTPSAGKSLGLTPRKRALDLGD